MYCFRQGIHLDLRPHRHFHYRNQTKSFGFGIANLIYYRCPWVVCLECWGGIGTVYTRAFLMDSLLGPFKMLSWDMRDQLLF